MELKYCRICNGSFGKRYVFKEMMFGMRDEFAYAECNDCGSIQILQVPDSIEKYYPEHYVSFVQAVPVLKRLPYVKRAFNNLRIKLKYSLSKNKALGYLKPIGLMPDAKILDIGCGKGALICNLFNQGFNNISGVDKFIHEPVGHGFNVNVLKKELSELPSDHYDLLMMHHVLEHVDQQIDELKECYRLLKKGGKLLICIPVIGAAWGIYKENWVQLDAPRHFILHTLKSIHILANKTGFKISKTVFDSSSFQFWGSELFKKDIPLTLPDTHEWYPLEQGFTAEQLVQFTAEANTLNENQKGDAARFYLYKN